MKTKRFFNFPTRESDWTELVADAEQPMMNTMK
jgi:hypothetical protein